MSPRRGSVSTVKKRYTNKTVIELKTRTRMPKNRFYCCFIWAAFDTVTLSVQSDKKTSTGHCARQYKPLHRIAVMLITERGLSIWSGIAQKISWRVCLSERDRERDRERKRVRMCAWERERECAYEWVCRVWCALNLMSQSWEYHPHKLLLLLIPQSYTRVCVEFWNVLELLSKHGNPLKPYRSSI